jgi:CheY-like chemotaxis protein
MAFIVAAIRDTATRGMIEAALAGLGHAVVFFRGGVPAVAEVLAGIPDLVFLDGGLVDIGVLHVVQVMRALPSTAAIPVLVYVPAVRVRQGLSARAAADDLLHVIGPPLLPASLRAAVTTALEAARREAARPTPHR